MDAGFLEKQEKRSKLKRQAEYARQMQVEEEQEAAAAKRRHHIMATQREDMLAKAMAADKTAKLREERELQLIREEAPELRELRAKLEAQTLNVTRQQQMEEAQSVAAAQKTREDAENIRMEAARQEIVHREEQKEVLRRAELRTQKQVLEEQMHHKQLAKLGQYQDFMREKEEVDAVVQRMLAEDQREMNLKREQMEKTKEGFSDYVRQREQIKAREREEHEAEEREIRRYNEQQSKREADHSNKLKSKQAEAERILEQQSREIAEEKRRKEELADLFMEYDIEMRKERDLMDEQRRRAKIVEERHSMNQANKYQERLKAAKVEAERQDELRYRDIMKQKFEEDERLEKLNTQRRAEARKDTFEEVSSILQTKRQMREEEKQRELEAARASERADALRKQVIEQEKEKMIQEHMLRMQNIRANGAR